MKRLLINVLLLFQASLALSQNSITGNSILLGFDKNYVSNGFGLDYAKFKEKSFLSFRVSYGTHFKSLYPAKDEYKNIIEQDTLHIFEPYDGLYFYANNLVSKINFSFYYGLRIFDNNSLRIDLFSKSNFALPKIYTTHFGSDRVSGSIAGNSVRVLVNRVEKHSALVFVFQEIIGFNITARLSNRLMLVNQLGAGLSLIPDVKNAQNNSIFTKSKPLHSHFAPNFEIKVGYLLNKRSQNQN